ncbi:MAG: biopolymer transporter ExbD [Pseudomonadales bacterium]|nr:biopolymer transporter ExbD [Pseudomonadales bacterium]
MSAFHHRRRRQEQKKLKKQAALNLVSLMDIFTILVFFLMVNSSEVEILETSPDIKLPDSTSEQKPDNRLVINVNAEDVVVQGRKVASVSSLGTQEGMILAELKQELEYQAARRGESPESGFPITIMGDREIPYWLLKQIMLTCQQTAFTRISLAVNRIEGAVATAPTETGVAS